MLTASHVDIVPIKFVSHQYVIRSPVCLELKLLLTIKYNLFSCIYCMCNYAIKGTTSLMAPIFSSSLFAIRLNLRHPCSCLVSYYLFGVFLSQ